MSRRANCWDNAYVSHCTSLVESETTGATSSLRESLTPMALRGGWVPGCSYRHSFLSLVGVSAQESMTEPNLHPSWGEVQHVGHFLKR